MATLTKPAAEIELFRNLLLLRSGIDFGRHREVLLESRVHRRMAKAGARSLYEYYRMVTEPGRGARELQALMDEVSIHETSFFRNPAQFALLSGLVLPDRIAVRLRSGERRLRLWSAGCSTGQELYSMVMVHCETVVLSGAWDLRFLGTDVSTLAVRHAKRGIYGPRQVEGLSPERLRRFFEKRGSSYEVRSWLRHGVEMKQGNLLEEAQEEDLDVIFCRNVMIYFDRERQKGLVRRLTRALAPNGYLFLGHTESLAGLTDEFRMVSLDRGIAYQRMR